MALTKRKKVGPMRCGMKRTATVSAVNQVIMPAMAIRIPQPGAPWPKTEWAMGSQLEVTPTQ